MNSNEKTNNNGLYPGFEDYEALDSNSQKKISSEEAPSKSILDDIKMTISEFIPREKIKEKMDRVEIINAIDLENISLIKQSYNNEAFGESSSILRSTLNDNCYLIRLLGSEVKDDG